MALRQDGGAGWDAVAARWERGRELLWAATRPVSERLVELLAPAAGERVLELAAGTGETGFLAAARLAPGGLLISSDRSPAMVAAARRRAAELGVEGVAFEVLDGERLTLTDASLDGVLSRFGYILRGEPPAALAEVRRTLRPGGRVAFAVWAERERNSWMTVPASVLRDRGHLGAPAPAAQRLSARRSPTAIARLLAEHDLATEEIEELEVRYAFADAEELWRFVSELRGPLSLVLDTLEGTELGAVRAALEERAERGAEGGFSLGGVAILARARR